MWGCAGTTEINSLQKLQNRAARIVTNSSFDTPSNQLIEKLGWKTINELIDIDIGEKSKKVKNSNSLYEILKKPVSVLKLHQEGRF